MMHILTFFNDVFLGGTYGKAKEILQWKGVSPKIDLNNFGF